MSNHPPPSEGRLVPLQGRRFAKALNYISHCRDIKQTEGGLDNVERHIESEIRRVERGVHPAEAKMAAEQIEQDLRAMEHTIQEMFQDAHALKEGRYPQASELHRR